MTGLNIRLASASNYSAIKAYVNYRKPLVSLELDGIASIKLRNAVFSNSLSPLNITLWGSSTAELELQHSCDSNVDVSETSKPTLSGRVQGDGQLTVSGIAQLHAIKCPMKIIKVEVSDAGLAYVTGVEGVHATARETGVVYYQGTLLSQNISGLGSIQEYIIENTSIEPQKTSEDSQWTSEKPQVTSGEPPHSSSENVKIMGKSRHFVLIPVTLVFFLFFKFFIN